MESNTIRYIYIEKDYNIAPSLLNQAIKLRQHANGKRESQMEEILLHLFFICISGRLKLGRHSCKNDFTKILLLHPFSIKLLKLNLHPEVIKR